jgi:hypothetical protein
MSPTKEKVTSLTDSDKPYLFPAFLANDKSVIETANKEVEGKEDEEGDEQDCASAKATRAQVDKATAINGLGTTLLSDRIAELTGRTCMPDKTGDEHGVSVAQGGLHLPRVGLVILTTRQRAYK